MPRKIGQQLDLVFPALLGERRLGRPFGSAIFPIEEIAGGSDDGDACVRQCLKLYQELAHKKGALHSRFEA